MAFQDMFLRLNGSIPKIPIDYCKILVNDAWMDVQRRNLWSWLLFEDRWSTPAIINQGVCQPSYMSNMVIADTTAAPLINAQVMGPPTPLIQRQFRVGIGGIYNIVNWQYNMPSAGKGILTLDQPYAEGTGGAGAPPGNPSMGQYTIFQCYYPAPVKDFKGWVSVRDMFNFINLFTNKTRAQIDASDPQRTWYYFPTDVVPFALCNNPQSPWYQYQLFELWGAPQYELAYQLYGMRKGTPLVNDTDTLPPQIGEDCVSALARMYGYEWAEANQGDTPRNQGPDWKYLMGAARKEYEDLFRAYRRDDRSTVNTWFMIRRISLYGKFFAYYNSIGGTSYPGVAMGG